MWLRVSTFNEYKLQSNKPVNVFSNWSFQQYVWKPTTEICYLYKKLNLIS